MSSHDEIFRPGGGFGRYQIERKLGEGGMCIVWQGRHKGLGKPVAIKVLKPDHAKNPLTRGRFQREGEAIARIHHANVVEVHDVGIVDGAPYLVMEYLEGEDLRAFFTRRGPLTLVELADVMVPVCSAVATAHDEGIVHRDLKPENIFLARTRDRGVVPKVLDFGISRVSGADGRNDTGTHAFMGTPRYMSPEQTQGAKNIDARSDQYSLGVILYQGATGRLPIDEEVLLRLLQRIVAGQFSPPRALRPDLTDDFESIILRAMATAPECRFVTTRELASVLLPYASERVRVLHSDSLVGDSLAPPPPRTSIPAPSAPRIEPTMPITSRPPSTEAAPAPPPLAAPVTWDTTLGASAREVPTNPLPRKRRSRRLAIVVTFAAVCMLALAGGALYPRASAQTEAPRASAPSLAITAPAQRVPSPAAPIVPQVAVRPAPATSAPTAPAPPAPTQSAPEPQHVAPAPTAPSVPRDQADRRRDQRPRPQPAQRRPDIRASRSRVSDEMPWDHRSPVATPVPDQAREPVTTLGGNIVR